jgi:PAS domain S-box-containing protein
MQKFLFSIFLLMQSQMVQAALKFRLRKPDGSTNWQHVANWSGGILILVLTIALITIFFTWRKARRANKELQAIRNDLELRVQERTAELRSSELYISDILRSMPMMLIGLDKDGNITQWNKHTEDITGIKADSCMGKNLWDIFPTITVSPNQIGEALSKNEATTIRYSQPGQYYYDITIYPLREQKEPGVVVLIDDITKEILSVNTLIHSDKMSSVGELAAAMSHDITPPLQAILSDLIMSKQSLADCNQQDGSGDKTTIETLNKLLADAHEKGESLASIVKSFQDFTKVSSDRKEICNMVDLMESTLELAGDVLSVPEQLRFKDIEIVRNFQPELPEIPCFIAEMQHVFLSLLRHACDALRNTDHPERTPTIKIQMIVSYDNLWIRIHHNGLGLSNEEQMYLFEPFFRKDTPEGKYDASKRLSFPYFIISEQHQGQMAVTSDLNVGTTFHIQLPLK